MCACGRVGMRACVRTCISAGMHACVLTWYGFNTSPACLCPRSWVHAQPMAALSWPLVCSTTACPCSSLAQLWLPVHGPDSKYINNALSLIASIIRKPRPCCGRFLESAPSQPTPFDRWPANRHTVALYQLALATFCT